MSDNFLYGFFPPPSLPLLPPAHLGQFPSLALEPFLVLSHQSTSINLSSVSPLLAHPQPTLSSIHTYMSCKHEEEIIADATYNLPTVLDTYEVLLTYHHKASPQHNYLHFTDDGTEAQRS